MISMCAIEDSERHAVACEDAVMSLRKCRLATSRQDKRPRALLGETFL